MKRTISLKELETILDKMPKTQIEEECHAWGCCSPHYKSVVTTADVYWAVKTFLEKK